MSLKEEALAKVRAFFDDCVPRHRRGLFTSVASKECPGEMKEIEELKEAMQKEEGPGLVYACNRYVIVSKVVIRRVSFVLAKNAMP